MRPSILTLATLALAVFAAAPVRAQDPTQWRPASTEMPAMPTASELRGDWMTRLAPWFSGLQGITGADTQGLRASGAPRAGGTSAEVARFLRGPVPVVVMTDRNGDERADMIEYYRDGRLAAQVIDSDYSGRANSLRFYDDSGGLIREVRL
jgi:hypothetical protein